MRSVEGYNKFKTVRYIYSIFIGNRLHVINLSQQSDAVDLLGGYKPFDSLLLLKQLYREFSIDQQTNDYIEEVQVNISLFCIRYFLFLFRNLFNPNDIKKL
jgi:midasin (ATPase involved in ribosome maturation)